MKIILFRNINAHHCWFITSMNLLKHGFDYRGIDIPEFQIDERSSFLERYFYLIRTAGHLQRELPGPLLTSFIKGLQQSTVAS